MFNKNILWIPIIGITGYLIWKYSEGVNELANSVTVTPQDVSFNDNILSPQFKINFSVANPSASTVTVTKIYGTVTNGGNILGTINQNNPVDIISGQTIIMAVNLTLSDTSIVTDVISGNYDNEFILDGYFDVGAIQVPFNQTLSL